MYNGRRPITYIIMTMYSNEAERDNQYIYDVFFYLSVYTKIISDP